MYVVLFSTDINFNMLFNGMLPMYLVSILVIIIMAFLSYKYKKDIQISENYNYNKSLL